MEKEVLAIVGRVPEKNRAAVLVAIQNKEKSSTVALVLLLFLGLLGAHQFYLGRTFWGLLYLCTGGLFLIGALLDLFFIWGAVKETNQKMAQDIVNQFLAIS